jgi:hypothetical protein
MFCISIVDLGFIVVFVLTIALPIFFTSDFWENYQTKMKFRNKFREAFGHAPFSDTSVNCLKDTINRLGEKIKKLEKDFHDFRVYTEINHSYNEKTFQKKRTKR